jgi:hypothetical protein
MRKLSILVVVIVIVAVGGFLFFLDSELPTPAGWPANVKLYRKTALGGLTRVVDTTSHKVIFLYLPEYDRNVRPIKMEKIDDLHWQVTFEAPQ